MALPKGHATAKRHVLKAALVCRHTKSLYKAGRRVKGCAYLHARSLCVWIGSTRTTVRLRTK